MRFSSILLSSAIVTFIPGTLAYPGTEWKQKLSELQERAARPVDGPDDSSELLGDLVTPGATTPVGKVLPSQCYQLRSLLTKSAHSRPACREAGC
jgi:hypothetical protein